MKTFTCDMGQLIPIMADEMVPGDVFKIGNQSVIRFQPLVAPILHEINAYVHYFFVPYRLLWSNWESFISGGADGSDASVPQSLKSLQRILVLLITSDFPPVLFLLILSILLSRAMLIILSTMSITGMRHFRQKWLLLMM